MKLTKKVFGLGAVALLALGLAACGNDDDKAGTDSTKSVGESLKYKITGIDPGAGIMEATEKAIEEYGLDEYDLVSGSGAAMTASLKKAYDKEAANRCNGLDTTLEIRRIRFEIS